MSVAKECLAAERAAAASGGARDLGAKAALDRFQAYLLQYPAIALQHFEAADTSRRGHLNFPEFARFLHNLIPDLQETPRRVIMSYLYAQDVDQSGVISWLMLARFMRVPQLAQLAQSGVPTLGTRSSYNNIQLASQPSQSPPPGHTGLRRMGTSPHRVTFEGDSWQLDEVEWRGEPYLLDRHTNRVYRQDQPGVWPRLVGVYRDGTVVIQERSIASSLFETLDAYLKQHRMRCKEVFSHFDSGSKGWLAPEELGRLVEHFLPGGQVTPGDIKYFQVMVDRNQDGRITYEEFLEAARSCRAEEAATRQLTTDVTRALQLVSDYVRNYGVEIRTAFSSFDVNRNGLLEPRELARLLRTAVTPPLSDQQLRYALAHLHAYDMDGDGCLSYREFCIAMRAVDARARVAGGREEVLLRGGFLAAGAAGEPAAPQMRTSLGGSRPRSRGSLASVDGTDMETDLVLQEFPYNGQMLLLDPRTQRVYSSPDGRTWPQLLGKLQNGRLTRTAELRPNDLWTRVDNYLKSNSVRLQELFNMYDADRSGSLRPSELGRLIRDMLPDVTRAELHYFLAMMDTNGDGAVSYDEFLAAAKDSLRATQQLSGVVGGAGGAGSGFPPDVLSVLDALSNRLAEQPAQARRIFNSCDRNNDGALDLSEAGRFLRALMPDLGSRQLQYVLSYLAALDLDGDGTLRFGELMTGLHALQARGPNGASFSRSFAAAPGSGGGVRQLLESTSANNRQMQSRANAAMMGRVNPVAYTRDWELQEWRYRGTTYLLDPTTGLVYGDVASAQEWPPLVGRKIGEAFQPLDSSATITFFRNLDAHLKSEQLKFTTLFSNFDRGRKGYLDRAELGDLVRRVMPEATEAQIRFLAVVLDENNDHVFTQQELLGAAKKVVELLRQQQAAAGVGSAGGFAGAPTPEVAAVLDRFSQYLRENMDVARATFESLDPERTGYLDYDRVAVFFRRLVASISRTSGGMGGGGSLRVSPEEQRYLLAQVHLYDVDGVGQVTFSELLRALHAADLRSARGVHSTGWAAALGQGGRRRSAASASAAIYDAPTTWRLEDYRWGDREVLLDPTSGVLYSRPRWEGDWPQPLGRLTVGPGGREAVTPVRPDAFSFFKRLDAFLKDNRVRLRQLFDASDTDRSGALDSREMGRLVKRVMPEATSPQMSYLLAMLDVHGMDQVTYEQFVQVCRDSMATEAAAAAAVSEQGQGLELPAEVAEALHRLSEALLHDRSAAVSLFRQADRDGSGRLEPREVATLLRRLVPNLRPEELRVAVVALFRNMDHNGDGTLSFQEFMYAMRAVDLQMPNRTITAGNWRPGRSSASRISPVQSYSSGVPAPREPVLGALDLEEVRLGGQRYMLSRYNNVVYEVLPPQASRAATAPQQWPRVVGIYDPASGGLLRKVDGVTSADLFSALDSYLKTARVRFSDVFARYDTDRNGRLEPRELGRLVEDLLGPQAAAPADVAYLVAMLDLDGSRSVSEQEFLSVAKEYLALERRAVDWSGAQSEDVRRSLERVSKYLQADKEGGYELFLRHDSDQTGRLTLRKLPGFFTELLRGQPLAQREMHYLLTHTHGSDVGKTGRFSYNDLLIAFRALYVRYPGGSVKPGFPAAPGGAAPYRYGGAGAAATPAFAQLEAFRHGGATYYRDPDTGLVYSLVDDRRLGPRLELVAFRTSPGRSSGGRPPAVISGPPGRAARGSGNTSPADRLFEALDAALKEHRVRLRDVFDRYDTNRNGMLEGRELGRLVRDLLPDAREADLRYLLAMLDYDGDSAVSYEELVAAVRECWSAVNVRHGGTDGDGPSVLEALLERIGGYLRSQRETAAATFARFDTNGNGRLEPRELARFLRACLPELSSADIRHLMTQLLSIDVNGDGALSYAELAHAMYGMELQLPDGRRLAARYVARPATGNGQRAAAKATVSSRYGNGPIRPYTEIREWRLEPWHCAAEERDYLLDRQTGLVYQLAPGGGADDSGMWPVVIGARTGDGRVKRLESTLGYRFFDALDHKLRIERVRLDELMETFDRDANARLDAQELGRLSSFLLGEELSVPSIKYLMALLDLDGDRLITREEVLEVFRQMGGVGKRVGGLQEPGVIAVLNRLSSALALNPRAAWERFCRADANATGVLEPRELRWFMDALLPGCGPSEMRMLMVYMHLLDVNDNGAVEWRELLVALRVLPARTQEGLLRPPRPPFQVRRFDTSRVGVNGRYRGETGSYDDTRYGDEDARRARRGSFRQDGSMDGTENDDYDVRGRPVDPASDITDREFVMELRTMSTRNTSRRRSSDRSYPGSETPFAVLLRDSESGLMYSPPDGAVKGAWPKLVAYSDSRDGGKRTVSTLSSWRVLLDLEELVRADPDRIMDAVEAVARRRSASSLATRGSLSASRGGGAGANEQLDIRTAAAVLMRLALEASGGGSSDGRRTDPWVEPLLRAMMEVMHDNTVRVRKLRPDVEALAAAYRLLTDPRDGPALLRDVAAGLNREYRKVVRAMRKRVMQMDDDEYGRDAGFRGAGGGGGLLRLRDVRDVLQDTLSEVLGSPEPAMAALLYLLYHCPHCLTRGLQPLALGWKDVFKALRAVKCRYPDGTSRVGVWEAEELARELSEASASTSSSGSSRSSSPAASQTSADRRRHSGGSRRTRQDDMRRSSRSHRHHHHQNPRSRHGRYLGSRGSYGPEGPDVYDPSIYGPGYNPAYGKRGSKYAPPYDVPPEVVAAQVAMGLDPAAVAELQRVASLHKSYNYGPAVAAASAAGGGMMMEDASSSPAVRQRISTDLRMSRVRSARQLNVAELTRRKVHPARRTVVLEPYTASDGQKYSLDPATGLVYFMSNLTEYPELAGKLRPSGEFTGGGGSSTPLQTVFNKLRTLDEVVLVQLFKAYDANNNGTLELKELMALLRDVTGLPYAEAGLVQALLDVDLSSTLTLKEWMDGIRASTDSLDAVSAGLGLGAAAATTTGGGAAAGGGPSRVQRNALTVLAAVSKQIAGDLDVFWAAYARADRDGNGYLDIAELTRFFKDLFRDMPAYDLRLLVAFCFTADLEKDGLVRPDELLQHLRAIPMQAPNGVTHLPGFRVPSLVSGRAGLMDSIRSINPNARLNYVKGLTVEIPEGGVPESLAAGLPSGHNFPGQAYLGTVPTPMGAASVYSLGGVGGIPQTPHGAASLAALSAASGGFAVSPYVPVPVPVPYMMPPAAAMPSGAAGATGGGSVMGYLLPYQQDMYQALMDRLTTPRTSVAGSRSGRRTSIASVRTPRMSEGSTVHSGAGSDGTPLSSDFDEEPQPPPAPVAPPPPPRPPSRSSYPQVPQESPVVQPPPPYVEQPPLPYPADSQAPPPYGGAPYPRRASYAGSYYGAQPQYPQQQHPYPYDPSQSMPYNAQQYGSVAAPAPMAGGNGFGAILELQRIVTSDPSAFHTHFTTSSRRVSTSSVPAVRRSYSVRPMGGYTHVVPRAALGQLVHRLYPGLRERERSYIVGVLAACLPYNTASYTEDDMLYAIRQGAAFERAVHERRIPADVAAVMARLADDVMGNAAYSAARAAFNDLDRFRRGYLQLTEAARMLTRLTVVPPTAVAWLTVGLAHYATTVLQGAADLSYKELGAALSYMSASAASAPLRYPDQSGIIPDSTNPYPPYPSPFPMPYSTQPSPYNGGATPYPERYPSLTSVPSVGTMPPSSPTPPPYSSLPASYDPRYPLSPRVSYSGLPPHYGSAHTYGGPPSPYAAPTTPYGPPLSSPGGPMGSYGTHPLGPYGSPPLSSYGSLPYVPSSGGPYGSYDHTAATGHPVLTDPVVAGTPGAAGLPLGAAYFMWAHDNRQAVVQKHLSEVLKGRVTELEAQKGALEKEAGLQAKILDLSNVLLANETAQRDVLGLIQSYTGVGTPPVSVAEMVGRIRTALEEAIQLARTSATAGAALPAGVPPPADFDSLLDALTNARWVGGQPVSTDTLRTALALRRDAFALRRAHAAAMLDLEARNQGMQVAGQEAQQAMSIQLQLLQAQLQRQAQELQQRLMAEAQALAAATTGGFTSATQLPLPGLVLPAAHAGTAALVTGLGATASPTSASSLAVASATPGITNAPHLVLSPRTWQLEPAMSAVSPPAPAVLSLTSPMLPASYTIPLQAGSAPSTGGLPAAVYPAPPHD
ncbi:hypothetical protein Vretifemale_10957 [Volvox reticuliferus]|uniref:EF-hand domain-containing protein n=2 Tax=Volvox reticuliferus TaxID=1737510 RepID=A0A8J4CGJ0_9CHLO|nr:hypothetical protein Vretifemale_10957 [Volvox reticuliferus]